MKGYGWCKTHNKVGVQDITAKGRDIQHSFNCCDKDGCEIGFILPPICVACGNRMKMGYDKIKKCKSKYIWKCKCTPHVQLLIGRLDES